MQNRFLSELKKAVNQAVHQCNNHLSIILSNCEMAMASNDPSMTKKKIENGMTRIAQLTDLLSQLNRFANINGDLKPTALRNLFEDAFVTTSARAQDLNSAFSAHIVADGAFTIPAEVFQLIVELLGANAISAVKTVNDRKINFEILQMKGEVTILASNSGQAPEAASEKLAFNSFYYDAGKPVFDSLAAVSSLTKLLGGEISYTRNSGMNEILLKLPLTYDNKVV